MFKLYKFGYLQIYKKGIRTIVQRYSSERARGLKDDILVPSPGQLAATVATYCPAKLSQLELTATTKHSEQLDE